MDFPYDREKLRVFSHADFTCALVNIEISKDKGGFARLSTFDYESRQNFRDVQNTKGLYTSTSTVLEISSERTKRKGQFGEMKTRITISPEHAWKFSMALTLVADWLTKPEYSSIFTRDEQGQPVSVEKKVSTVVALDFGEKLVMQPTVLSDQTGCRYEGVSLYATDTLIGSMTPYEYMHFKLTMEQVLNNLIVLGLSLMQFSRTDLMLHLLLQMTKGRGA